MSCSVYFPLTWGEIIAEVGMFAYIQLPAMLVMQNLLIVSGNFNPDIAWILQCTEAMIYHTFSVFPRFTKIFNCLGLKLAEKFARVENF